MTLISGFKHLHWVNANIQVLRLNHCQHVNSDVLLEQITFIFQMSQSVSD